MMMFLWFALTGLWVQSAAGLRYIKVVNKNTIPIWIQSQPNKNQPSLKNGRIVKLNPNKCVKYDISDAGWAGRLWAKVECDSNGVNCKFGQSLPPCPAAGCQPPAETKVEFFIPAISSSAASYYDISLVDGYSLGAEITPYSNVRGFIFIFVKC